MAGTYADIPGTRFALDQDGTVLKYRNYTTSSAWTDVTGSMAEIQKVNTANNIDTTIGAFQSVQFAFAFPEPRSINGAYIHGGTGSNVNLAMANVAWDYSTDTTDGTDGTWSSVTVTFTNFTQHNTVSGVSKPYYRSDIATLAVNNVKGVRVRFDAQNYGNPRLCVLHLYGTRSTASVDRLAFWHPSSDQAIGAAALDFGDIAQGVSVTKQFRVKNLSSSLTANTITVQVSDLLPEYTGTGLQVSTDNVTYQNSVNIGNLSSGVISSTLYVRRTVPGAETTTQRQARLLANAASWS
jgi:hypothetical protein